MPVFKKNNRWWVDYSVNGKRIRKPVADSKALAQKVLTKIQSDIVHKKYSLPTEQKIKFKDFATKFIEEYSRPTKKSYKHDIFRLKHLLPFFGDLYLHEISDYHYELYRKRRVSQKVPGKDKCYSHQSFNLESAQLKCMLNRAVKWGILSHNPIKNYERFRVEHRERVLTQDEMKRLVKAAPPDIKPYILIALNTGMRKGEILNLEWNQVNIEDRFITIKKTKSSKVRRVPLNDTLVDLFTNLYDQRINEVYVFFNPMTGRPLRAFHSKWSRLLKQEGITDFRFHDLRHCFATYALLNGGDLMSLKETLGHSEITTTSRYTKALMEGQRKLVNVFEVKDEQGEPRKPRIEDIKKPGKVIYENASYRNVSLEMF